MPELRCNVTVSGLTTAVNLYYFHRSVAMTSGRGHILIRFLNNCDHKDCVIQQRRLQMFIYWWRFLQQRSINGTITDIYRRGKYPWGCAIRQTASRALRFHVTFSPLGGNSACLRHHCCRRFPAIRGL